MQRIMRFQWIKSYVWVLFIMVWDASAEQPTTVLTPVKVLSHITIPDTTITGITIPDNTIPENTISQSTHPRDRYASSTQTGQKRGSKEDASPVYVGKPISLNFQDIPIRNALQIIADASQFNLVMSDAVKGNITLRLEQVPWDQALATILALKKLTQRRLGTIITVSAQPAALTAQKNMVSHSDNADAISSEFIAINYANAADVVTMLTAHDAHLLSSRGHVSFDARTNTVLVRDTPLVIQTIKSMVQVLDVPVRQVVIEARMVTVNESIGKKLGVQWGGTGSLGQVAGAGTLQGIAQTGSDSLSDRLSVNLPVLGAAGNLALQMGQLASGNILDLQLSALEQENKAEIIATPRITALNHQTAYIEQGTEIPYVEASSSGATSVSFKKAVLSLKVTPQIMPNNNVMLDLVITQDAKGDTVSTSTGDAVAINTQEISTQVLAKNQQTLVLGGIYQARVTNTVNKVPLLGDIPFLGYFFRNTQHETSKAELLIFVTPHIVTQKKRSTG